MVAEFRRIVHKQGSVRTERRIDLGLQRRVFGDRPMKCQIVNRIVRRAKRFDVELSQDAVGAQIVVGQPLFARSQIAGAVAFVQQVVDVEEAFQLQMRPVIQWVPQRVGDGCARLKNLSFGVASPVQ